jgi:multidrug efflux system membrane fusion protein
LQNAVTVPTSAIQRGAPGAYVYVINADDTVSVRQVSTGPVDGNITAINSGLSAGERVVTDGTDRLRDGVKIVVVGERGGTPGGAPGGASGQGRAAGQHSGRSQNQPPAENK